MSLLQTITHCQFCRLLHTWLLHISLPILHTITHGHFADYYSCRYNRPLLIANLQTITQTHVSLPELHTITHANFVDYYSCPYQFFQTISHVLINNADHNSYPYQYYRLLLMAILQTTLKPVLRTYATKYFPYWNIFNTLHTVCFMHGLSIYEIKRIYHRAYFFRISYWSLQHLTNFLEI